MVPGSQGVDPGTRGRRAIRRDMLTVSPLIPGGYVRTSGVGGVTFDSGAGAACGFAVVNTGGCSNGRGSEPVGHGKVDGTVLLGGSDKTVALGRTGIAAEGSSVPKKSPSSLCRQPLLCGNVERGRFRLSLCNEPLRCSSTLHLGVARSRFLFPWPELSPAWQSYLLWFLPPSKRRPLG